LKETKVHAQRLEKILNELKAPTGNKRCGDEGLIAEGKERIERRRSSGESAGSDRRTQASGAL